MEEGDKAGKTEEPGGKQGEKTTSADAAGRSSVGVCPPVLDGVCGCQ